MDNLGLSFTIEADGSGATKTLNNLAQSVDKSTQNIYKTFDKFEKDYLASLQKIEKGFSDISIQKFGSDLKTEFNKNLKTTNDYQESLRQLKPKIQSLYKDILGGSFDQEDFERRFKLVPDRVRQLITDAEHLGQEIKGVAEETKPALTNIEALGQAFGLSEKQATALGAALPVVGAAVTAVAAAVTAAGIALFQASKATAEYASEIDSANKQTGVSVETLSALRYAGEQTKTSFSDITEAISDYSRTVADAATGSDEAKDKLKRLGIEPQAAIKDLEGSVELVIQKILALPNPIAQAKAANDAFGDSGEKLLPMLKSFNGNIGELIANAKKLGVTLTDADVKAAKEFDKSLNELNSVITGVVRQFSQGLMPAIVSVMNTTKQFAVENKKDIKDWGDHTGKVLLGLIGYWKDLKKSRDDYEKFRDKLDTQDQQKGGTNGYPTRKAVEEFQKRTDILGGLINTFNAITGKIAERGEQELRENKPPKRFNYSRPQDKKVDPNSPEYLADLKAQEETAKKREELEKKELSAKIERLRNFISEAERAYADATEKFRKEFQENKDGELFTQNINSATTGYLSVLDKIYPQLDNFVRQQTLKEKEGANERLAVYEKEQQDKQKRLDAINKSINENERLVTESSKNVEKERIKNVEKSLKDELELREAANKTLLARAESLKAAGVIDDQKLLQTKHGLQGIYQPTDKRPQYDDPTNTVFEVDTGKTDNQGKRLSVKYDIYTGFLKFRKDLLLKELESVRGNTEEETRVYKELGKLKEEITATYYLQKKEQDEANYERNQRSAEDEKQQLEEILQLKYELLQVEHDLSKLRAEGVRRELERNVRDSVNKSEPLTKLRDFDSMEAMRQNARDLLSIDDSRMLELNKANAIKNETDKLAQISLINRKYDQEELIALEQYEQRKKEIKDRYQGNINIETKREAGVGMFGGFADALGMDVSDGLATRAEYMKGVYKDLASTAGAALGSMVEGAGQLLQTWILTGKITGQAVKQMTASIIAGVAAQAAVKAIFEVAEGLAALANPLTAWQAPGHFAAAKVYGLVSLAATAVGATIGALGGLGGKSDATATKSGTASSSASSSVDKDKERILVEERLHSAQQADFDRQRITNTLERLDKTIQNGIPIKVSGKLGLKEEDAEQLFEKGLADSYGNQGAARQFFNSASDGNTQWNR